MRRQVEEQRNVCVIIEKQYRGTPGYFSRGGTQGILVEEAPRVF